MGQNGVFKRYRSRLVAEGILKSIICGLSIGFAVNFLVALVCWLVGITGGVWLAIGCWLCVSAIFGVLFYFLKFRPTTKEIARRVDRLGLHERLITMLELEKDESYIAMRQREDAKERLKSVNTKQLRFRFSKVMIVLIAVFALMGTSMTTFAGLAENGLAPLSPFDPDNPINFLEVTYAVEGNGQILGETKQVVKPGQNASSVIAVPDDGFIFVGWDDGFDSPSRMDLNIRQSIYVTAVFQSIDGAPEEDLTDGDDSNDKPGEEGDSGSTDEPGEPGDPGDPSDPEDPGPDAGGRFEDSNQIIDGNTYYRDYLEDYYNKVKDGVLSSDSLNPVLRDMLERYYGSL